MKRVVILILTAILLIGCAAEAPKSAGPEAASVATESEEKTLERLEVAHRPDKLEYLSGETFDPTGLVINAFYSDGSVVENVAWEAPETVITSKMSSIAVTCMGKELRITFTVLVAGNQPQYSVAQTPEIENSPIKGQTFLWLGSSVTYGAESEQESMADFFGKKYGVQTVKLALSGTSLATYKPNSYAERLDKYITSAEKAPNVDAFICQLSTNDTNYTKERGVVMPDFITDSSAFDIATTYGAIEYIIARVRETWDCPIYFYTNPPTGNAAYGEMVDALFRIAEKWDVTVIDLYTDASFNSIDDAARALYMSDSIHPTKAGYRDWWLPKFEEALLP